MIVINQSDILRDLDPDTVQRFQSQMEGDKFCRICQEHIVSGKYCESCKEDRKS